MYKYEYKEKSMVMKICYNRYPQWPHHKCENLVDSVMKNYPIHTFITSEHKKQINLLK